MTFGRNCSWTVTRIFTTVYWWHMTQGRVSASIYRSLLQHLDLYRIYYQFCIYILINSSVQPDKYNISAAKYRCMCRYTIFNFSVIRCVSLMRIHMFYLYCQNLTQPTDNEQPACQFYLWLCTIPSKIDTRSQLRWTSKPLSMEYVHFPLRQVTPILNQSVSILLEDEIHNESHHDDEESTADRDDELSNSLGNSLGNEVCEHQPTAQYEHMVTRNQFETQRQYQLRMVHRDEFKRWHCIEHPVLKSIEFWYAWKASLHSRFSEISRDNI